MKNIQTDTLARTIVLFIALLNQILAITGKSALPIAENDIYQLLSLLFTITAGVTSWWKNNSFTTEAKQADIFMKKLKEAKDNGNDK